MRERHRVAAHLAHGAAVRRGRRAVRRADRGQLRGPGGGRARGAGHRAAAPTARTTSPASTAIRSLPPLSEDLNSGIEVETVAARFHAGVAAGTCAAVAAVASARGLGTAVLSGGVFQNRLLLTETAALLEAEACACSSPSACRPTTAASPTARRPWPRRSRYLGVSGGLRSRRGRFGARWGVARERAGALRFQATVP